MNIAAVLVATLHLVLAVQLLTTATADAAGNGAAANRNAEYLAILGQKGTQIISEIRESEQGLHASRANSAGIAVEGREPAALGLATLVIDMRLLTLEGDHLQSVVTIARQMVAPADAETALRFVRVIAEEAARRVETLRSEVNAVSGKGPDGALIDGHKRRVLAFMDEFANAVEAIARELN